MEEISRSGEVLVVILVFSGLRKDFLRKLKSREDFAEGEGRVLACKVKKLVVYWG